ncbi:MAG: recombinase family protein [Bradyrhizobium sp.]|nr:recombinase family protein [Bradyrhizobium sp.]
MVNALVIRKGTSPAKRGKMLRAAQYVRMSTDYQRYSIQNQAAAIAAFAQQRNLTIVRTYMDEGRSGLRIRGRPGLIELIDDVRSGQADFDQVLVYDVSRWGRFQDVDESAHYEFICKENGIKVAYCAEQFDNDGSLLSSIVKNIKRVMAAEYSRDLSVKVHTGQCRVASLGFRVGGPLTFGLRRELVGENRQPKGRLDKGERKSLQTDRVRLALGSQEEAAVIRWIFHQFVVEEKADAAIARELNQSKVANQHGRPWTDGMIHNILRNENYVGNIVYNRTSRRLGQKLVNNPLDGWVRSDQVVDAIIDPGLFTRARNAMENRYISISEEEMLLRLRLLLKRQGKLTFDIINRAACVPSASSYVKHFGSLRNALALIGYDSPRDCDWIDRRRHWSEVLSAHAAQIVEALNRAKHVRAQVDARIPVIILNGRIKIHFQVARQSKKRGSNHAAAWRVHRRRGQSGLLVVLRLDEVNRTIEDYLILRSVRPTQPYLYFSARGRDHGAVRAETIDDLVAILKRQLNKIGALRLGNVTKPGVLWTTRSMPDR